MNRILIFGGVGLIAFLGGLMISGIWPLARQKAANARDALAAKAPAPNTDLGKDEDPKNILNKAIAAHGGAAKLDSYQTVRCKYHGYKYFRNIKCVVSGDEVHQRPDKMKTNVLLANGPNQIIVTVVSDGNAIWLTDGDKRKEYSEKRDMTGVRQELLLECYTLGDYLKSPYELTNMGIVDVKGNETIGIRVAKAGENDVLFFFDKKTHLIAKTQAWPYEPDLGRDVNHERYILAYQELDGVKFPQRFEIYKGGRLYSNIEVTSVTSIPRLDDSFFTKPWAR